MRALFFICIVIIVAAPGAITRYLAFPDGERTSAEGQSSIAERTTTRPRAARPHASGSQFQVKAKSDGHFYVDALINRQRVHLMVDTGASVVALRQSDAESAGIRVRKTDYDRPVATANGEVKAAETEIDSIALRDIEVSGVRALVLPDESLSVSLLGATFLNRLARFEVSDGTLMFEN